MGSKGDAPRLSGSRVRRRSHAEREPLKRQRLAAADERADRSAFARPPPVVSSGSASSSAVSRRAMSIALLNDDDDDDVVVGESCCSPREDIDMGTPAAAISKATQDWWLAHPDRVTDKDKGEVGPSARSHFTQDDGITSQHIRDEQLMSFREYNDSDIDSLVISPSQDFDGGVQRSTRAETGGEEPAVHASCPWVAYQDETQFYDEEASEVFDDVIYAPRKSAPPPQSSKPTPGRSVYSLEQSTGVAYDRSSELSDGFDVRAAAASDNSPNASSKESSTHPVSEWHARSSVKRDCSFVDCTTRPRRHRVCVEELSESSEEFEEKLKLGDADEDQGEDEGALTADTASSSSGVYSPPSSSACPSKSGPASAALDTGFRPRKKRRKVRQLALDAFLRTPPSASL